MHKHGEAKDVRLKSRIDRLSEDTYEHFLRESGDFTNPEEWHEIAMAVADQFKDLIVQSQKRYLAPQHESVEQQPCPRAQGALSPGTRCLKSASTQRVAAKLRAGDFHEGSEGGGAKGNEPEYLSAFADVQSSRRNNSTRSVVQVAIPLPKKS